MGLAWPEDSGPVRSLSTKVLATEPDTHTMEGES